jgi:hypothetical protein
MEIDGKLPPWFPGYGFQPIAPVHTAQSGICVPPAETGRLGVAHALVRTALTLV